MNLLSIAILAVSALFFTASVVHHRLARKAFAASMENWEEALSCMETARAMWVMAQAEKDGGADWWKS